MILKKEEQILLKEILKKEIDESYKELKSFKSETIRERIKKEILQRERLYNIIVDWLLHGEIELEK